MATVSQQAAPERRVVRIEIDRIAMSPFQPRGEVDAEGIGRLAESIRSVGQISPLLVRRDGQGGYQLVAGERRLRAMRLLGWNYAEAIVTAARDRESALVGLIENVQREELHFLDEARACRNILRDHGLSREELAAALGRSPSALANLLRLLRLGREVQNCVREGGLSERHARALLRAPDDAERLRLAELAVERKLSVRELEAQLDLQSRGRKPERPALPAGLSRDSRLVINALKDTVRQLKRIGVPASCRVEAHGDCYDVIVTIRTPCAEV